MTCSFVLATKRRETLERLEAPGVPARAHPDEHLLDGALVEGILLTERFPGRQFHLAALDASNPRPRETDLPTSEDERPLRGSMPEGLAIGPGLAPGAAQHRLVLFEEGPEDLESGMADEVTERSPDLHQHLGKGEFPRGGRPPRGKLAVPWGVFRAILLHDGGSSFGC